MRWRIKARKRERQSWQSFIRYLIGTDRCEFLVIFIVTPRMTEADGYSLSVLFARIAYIVKISNSEYERLDISIRELYNKIRMRRQGIAEHTDSPYQI